MVAEGYQDTSRDVNARVGRIPADKSIGILMDNGIPFFSMFFPLRASGF